MKKIAGSLIALFLVLAVLSTPLFADGSEPSPESPCPAFGTALMAGQYMPAGDVCVWTEGDTLKVQFVAGEDWSLGETHLYVGWEQPTKAAPGRFPYKDAVVTSNIATYTIPWPGLADSSGETLYIAAHAVVQRGTQQETAWGAGSEFGKGWAMYFHYPVVGESYVPEE